MSRSRSAFVSLGAAILVAACASTPNAKPQPAATAAQTPTAPRSPTILGLESVLGRDARVLAEQFGKADLDVREGTARKLQFSGPACVLDVYLYPRQGGGEPVATHVDARLPDGRDMDRASCVAAIMRRPEAR